MSVSAVDTSHVGISRLTTHYLVPADHPAPYNLKARLDETVAKSLPRVIDALLRPLCSPNDEHVWLIRGVHLDIGVNDAWEPNRITRALGEALTHRVDTVMRSAADKEKALCFSNRAAYLAQFLFDCAMGWAWGKWYYEAFEGLRLLPTSAAIRTAVLDHSTTGLAALQHLTPSKLEQVVSALAANDSRLLVEELVRSGARCADESTMRAAWDLWQRGHPGKMIRDEFWKLSLQLLIATSRERPTGEALSPLLRCPLTWVQKVTDTLRGADVIRRETRQGDRVVSSTRFGGLFLLLPLLAAFPWEQGTEGWPDCEGIPSSFLLRFLVFMKCCGGMRAEQVFRDPLVRDLLGISPAVSVTAMRRWQRHIRRRHVRQWLRVNQEDTHLARIVSNSGMLSEEFAFLSLPKSCGLRSVCDRALSATAQRILRVFAQRLPGFGGSGFEYVYRQFLDCSATMEEEAARRIVRLGRLSLQLILDMAGMSRSTYILSWLDERPIMVFPSEGDE